MQLGTKSLITKPNFKSNSVFKFNFVAIQLDRWNVFYNKPVYVGFTVVELTKTVMWYNFNKSRFEDKVTLLYTGTNSLIIQIGTHNIYQFM